MREEIVHILMPQKGLLKFLKNRKRILKEKILSLGLEVCEEDKYWLD